MKQPASGPNRARFVTIGPDQAGQRIDNFLLRELKGVPRSMIYRILRKGEVRVNKGRIKAVYRLREGDSVRIPPIRLDVSETPAAPGEALRAQLEKAVLYEDEELLVLDKPSGLAVHAGSGIRAGIIEMLRAMRPEMSFLELVHRLDRETSGCLLLARSRSALTALHAQIREQDFDKRYLALVAGGWHNDGDITVDAPLRRIQRGGERLMVVDPAGKPAVTHLHPVDRLADATLVEARIETGRTHQIRVHCAHIGHPLAGDARYGERDFNRRIKSLGLRRLFLHAHSLAFTHPRSGQPMHFSAPMASDLRQVLDKLQMDKA